MLTDHILSNADLKGVAKRIKSGNPATFDKESVAMIRSTIEQSDLEQVNVPLAEPVKGGWIWVLIVAGLFISFFWFLLTR
ncbi:MAG: hypothetical protein H7145_19565 [Akkermansiaceae bacterium]|nr:hypothetical protein [Armatimonadota bacterium]